VGLDVRRGDHGVPKERPPLPVAIFEAENWSMLKTGALYLIRTDDPFITNEVLYQLS
jgi:hypothetical protein